jgi:hypothetical protein
LQLANIKIYGYIDVYSRKIIWIFMDFFTRTQVSIMSQFFIKLEKLNVMLQIIRSDRGVKIDIIINAFFTLQRDVERPQLNLNEYYYFEKSIKNIRIKSW